MSPRTHSARPYWELPPPPPHTHTQKKRKGGKWKNNKQRKRTNKPTNKSITTKTYLLTRAVSHNGFEIDAQSHQSSMPKQVPNKIMGGIRSNVCLMCKNMKLHCTDHWFRRFCSLGDRTESYRTTFKIDTNIHPQINEQSMQNLCSKKRPKLFKTYQDGSQGGASIMTDMDKYILDVI